MATSRRLGAKSSETRTILLDIAETIMREEGYAAVSSRQLAKTAKMSPQIVYYYFRTMDDLFAALFLRFSAFFDAAIEDAAVTDDPILAMWNLNSDPSRALLITEFMALANHRKSIAALISRFGERYHARQAQIIAQAIEARGLELGEWTPVRLATVMENLSRSFAFAASFDIAAQVEARDFTGRWLSSLLRGGKSLSHGA